MREIKFRGWTASTKQMICEGWNETGAASFFIAKGDLFDYGDSMQIMQYTGLNDKNDKEIYEGDIIQRVIDSTEGERRLAFGPVVFHFGGFCMSCEGLLYPLSRQFQICEVIGNIYENPELLKP